MNTNTKSTLRIVPSGIVALAGALLLVGTGATHAEDFTGCVTRGGTIISVAPGETPLGPCKPNERLIHLEWNVKNNPQTLYNHLAVCAALTGAGVDYATYLEPMGCPKAPTVSTDTVSEILKSSELFQGLDYKSCGVALENRPEWADGWHIVVYGTEELVGGTTDYKGGAHLAYTEKIDIIAYPDNPGAQCQSICQGDEKCVAARFSGTNVPGSKARESRTIKDCDIFYHIDKAKLQYNLWCGTSPDSGLLSCQASQTRPANEWYARSCP
jgi:hypothetical protein